jgi:hypothetical protein
MAIDKVIFCVPSEPRLANLDCEPIDSACLAKLRRLSFCAHSDHVVALQTGWQSVRVPSCGAIPLKRRKVVVSDEA